MTTASETAIRKELAKRLDVLEPGLTLVEEEHYLPNLLGGKGFVDIWARDSHGMHVIIELKRSNAAARHALHELFKYVGLFRMNHGIPAHKIRCLVVSTEWHELLVPFAEFTNRAEFQSEGFQLVVDAAGIPMSATRVGVPDLPTALKIFRQHCYFMFADEAARSRFASKIDETMTFLGSDGHLVISTNYTGNNPSVINRFGVYVVPASVKTDVAMDIERVVRGNLELAASDLVDRESLEGEFLSRLIDSLRQPIDEYSGASPELYAVMRDQGWRRTSIIRRGQLASEMAYSDDDLDRLIMGFEGTNAVIYFRVAKPANKLDWKQAVSGSEYCLLGNDVWASCCASLFKLIEQEYPEASVLISIYNPLCLPEALYSIARNGDFGWVPKLEIVVNQHDGMEGWIARGVIQWDGATCPPSPEQFFFELSGGVDKYYERRQFNDAWPLDSHAMASHGLIYGMVRTTIRDGEVVEGDTLTSPPDSWAPVIPGKHLTNIFDFVRTNGHYLQSFADTLDWSYCRI